MKCMAIRHLEFENLGTFEEVLINAGFEVEYVNAGVQRLETCNWNGADLLVVLGGPIGVYEIANYPWLKEEIERVGQRVRRDLPTLGICLGAQIIAASLGAAVYPGPAKEIGWSPLQLSDAAQESSLKPLEHVEVLHWHGDTFDLPQGATLLASTDLTPHQAFSYQEKTLALQFHAEAHGERMEPWLIGHSVELGVAGIEVPKLRQAGIRRASENACAGQAMFRQWLRETGLS
jgi:GMP synthase (glutamine-hydrolysing)